MMDFSSMYTPNCNHSLWHNTLSWNVKENPPKTPCPGRGTKGCWFTGKTWKDHKYQPHHILERAADSQSDVDAYKELSGEVKNHAFTKEVDYISTSLPLIEFDQSVFYNKVESDNPVPWGPYQELATTRLTKKYEWQRRFVFVKDEDLHGPNYFFIRLDKQQAQCESRRGRQGQCQTGRESDDPDQMSGS